MSNSNSDSSDSDLSEQDALACHAVGKFFFNWSFVEVAIENALATALRLDQLDGLKVLSNMTLSAKINAFRTAGQVYGLVMGVEWTSKFDALVKHLEKYARTRNIFAHNPFFLARGGRPEIHARPSQGQGQIPHGRI